MAATRFYYLFRSTPRPDELCTHCLNPSLALLHYVSIDIDGVTVIGERLQCRDGAKTWMSPLKEYASHGEAPTEHA